MANIHDATLRVLSDALGATESLWRVYNTTASLQELRNSLIKLQRDMERSWDESSARYFPAGSKAVEGLSRTLFQTQEKLNIVLAETGVLNDPGWLESFLEQAPTGVGSFDTASLAPVSQYYANPRGDMSDAQRERSRGDYLRDLCRNLQDLRGLVDELRTPWSQVPPVDSGDQWDARIDDLASRMTQSAYTATTIRPASHSYSADGGSTSDTFIPDSHVSRRTGRRD